MQKCVKFLSFKDDFKLGTPVHAPNYTRRSKPFTCRAEESKTVSYGVSVSVEAEAGVIFAKAKTSVTGNIQRSVTQSTSMQWGPFRVPGRSMYICNFGVSTFLARGRVRYNYKPPGEPWQTEYKRFRATLPSGPSCPLRGPFPL